MNAPTVDPKIMALGQIQQAARRASHRAKAIEQMLLAGEADLDFAADMLREAVSGLDFWFEQFEKARKA